MNYEPYVVSPTTPGQRNKVNLRVPFTSEPVPASLRSFKRSTGGRNNQGKITLRGRGAGTKRKHVHVTYDYFHRFSEGQVVGFLWDSRHSALLARVRNEEGEDFYLLAEESIKEHTTYFSGLLQDTPCTPGSVHRLKDVPMGTLVYGVSRVPNGPAVFLRSAGACAKLGAEIDGKIELHIPNKRMITLSSANTCTIGKVSGESHRLRRKGKAGVNRGLGRRPHVRGVAMNPVDHPHGGGEGKTSGGRPSVTPWGKLTKGVKTAKVKHYG